jgi:hypothetical protein
MKTVKELRQEGYRVRVTHYRNISAFGVKQEEFRAKDIREVHNAYLFDLIGGRTVVSITDKNGATYTGMAVNKNDPFCYKTGVRIALERALKGFGA